MTRKRFKKLMMSIGATRNNADQLIRTRPKDVTYERGFKIMYDYYINVTLKRYLDRLYADAKAANIDVQIEKVDDGFMHITKATKIESEN